MSEPKLISPMLDDFIMGDPLSEHHGVRCCPALRKDSDSRYIVKIISVPASQVQLEALLLAGAYSTHSAALSYFKEMAEEITDEVEILKKLSKFEGFLPYEDYQIVPMEDEVGYDVYLLSPYKRTLERYIKSKPITHLNAVNMGLDLCASMAMCRRAGFLYIDLKPSNIFVNDKNEFCIGDLGFVRLNSLKYASLPDKFRSAYTAPEIKDAMSSLNSTIDIYAIGKILYEVYNDGKLPTGMEGSSLSAPIYADYEMTQIILKACDPDPEKRWQDPLQMGQALVEYMQRNGVNDTPIVPLPEPVSVADPIPVEPTDTVSEDPDTPAIAEDETVPVEDVPADEIPTDEPPADEFTSDEAAVSEDESDKLSAEIAAASLQVPVDEGSDDDDDELFDDVAADLPEEPADDGLADTFDTEADALPAVVEDDLEMPPVTDEDDDPNPFDSLDDPKDITDLSFMASDDSDETLPQDDDATDVDYGALSDDASSILTLADELIAHETPEPVVAPEPIEVPMPEPLKFTEDEDELSAELAAALTEKEMAQTEVFGMHDFINDVHDSHDEAEDDKKEYDPVITRREREKKPLDTKLLKRIAIFAGLIALAVAMFFGAYYYYTNFYLQSIDELTLTGYGNQLTVELTTNVDQSLLTIDCTDTYGTIKTAEVQDGKAVFSDLNPNTLYTVKVSISGFHELIGDTTDRYTTPAQTTIVSFHAIAGSEDGSVILNFTVDGQDSGDWVVEYSTEGEEPRQQTFTGHMVTIGGLTLDKSYTFRLTSPDLLYIVGKDALTYTATSLILAENLTITSCNADGLSAEWTVPDGAAVANWTVRCYNDQGYDETITTADTSVIFTGIDPAAGYTVEVTAEGMTVNARAFVSENSATISNFRVAESSPTQITLAWDTAGVKPAEGWLVLYHISGYEQQDVLRTTEDQVILKNPIPGETYEFLIQASDGTTVFDGSFTYTAEAAASFAGYGVSADKMTFSMCNTPEEENWSGRKLKASDFTNTFASGSKASFVAKLSKKYNTSSDQIVTMYVIRNSENKIVSSNTTSQTWTAMWYQFYCELDVPTIPTEPGTYTITIYFNGMTAHQQEFTVTA